MVVSIGIDVSKDKHDCFIVSSEGKVLADAFTIPNTMDGFNCLLQRIQDCTTPQDKMKVGLEATGHYSYNLLGFLLDNGLTTYVYCSVTGNTENAWFAIGADFVQGLTSHLIRERQKTV